MGTLGGTTWCMTVPGAEFIGICDDFPEFRSYMNVRGVHRRSHFKLIQAQLYDRFKIGPPRPKK